MGYGKARRRHVVAAMAVGMAATTAISALPAPALAEHEPVAGIRAVQRQLDLMTSEDRVPGALAEVNDRQGRSVTLKSGTADLVTGRPMPGPHGRFRIASVTKTFTAVTVLRLVAEGRVRLDEPIETYLPGELRGVGEGAAIHGRDITVRQLLQHTSGLPNYTQFIDLQNGQPAEAAELVRIALSHRPDFSPGKSWNYSNTGYLVAGMLVERVTGRDIATVVTERVIRPAGLRHTYWPPAGELTIRGQHARNYVVDPTKPQQPLVDVTEFEPSLGGAAGAIVSTPSDLNRFWRQLFDGRLLPPKAMKELRTSVPVSDEMARHFGKGTRYGLGILQVPLSCGGFVWGHAGDLVGVSNLSGRNDGGRQATVYLTAQTGSERAARRHLDTVDTAFCGKRPE